MVPAAATTAVAAAASTATVFRFEQVICLLKVLQRSPGISNLLLQISSSLLLSTKL